MCGQKCGNRYFLISAVHEIQNYWLLLCCGEFQDCYCVSIKKIQTPFQGDDTKGLEEGNWISLQSWVPWVTVIPRQTSGTDLHKIYIYTSVERFYHEKNAILSKYIIVRKTIWNKIFLWRIWEPKLSKICLLGNNRISFEPLLWELNTCSGKQNWHLSFGRQSKRQPHFDFDLLSDDQAH